ncbi:hypothetical protein AARAC_011975 [Aspergillus arachidicola]|uniref:F-box domain-containing protein n=1 Tax=Aspergillus arachidicola TaxID=656916 RepID=A0A2G7FMF1_9EURO|nr:hypothetical protein AARAC_011975 [Aspergillus arachidicola]
MLMSLLRLPIELLISIGSRLEKRDLRSLYHVCRTTSSIFKWPLWKSFDSGESALNWAVYQQDYYLVRAFVNDFKADIHGVYKGETPLIVASRFGWERGVRLLVAYNLGDVNRGDDIGRTALWWAVDGGHIQIVSQLLKLLGIDLNKWDTWEGRTPIAVAAKKRDIALLKLLLSDARTNPNLQSFAHETPLHAAVRRQDCTVVRTLTQSTTVNINSRDLYNMTPTIFAVRYRMHGALRQLLLSANVDHKVTDDQGHSALWYAVDNGDEISVQLLLDNMEAVYNCRETTTRESLLELAIARGCEPVVRQLLLQQKYSLVKEGLSFRTLDQNMAFLLAVEKGQARIAQICLSLGATINASRENGESALHLVARQECCAIACFLLSQKGLNINAPDKTLRTPLHNAIIFNRLEFISTILAEPGIRADARDMLGRTPFWYATREGRNPDIAGVLLDYGVDYNAPDSEGCTPLGSAAESGNTAVLRLLLGKRDIHVNARTDDEIPPLWLACRAGQVDIAEILLNNRADINQRSREGTSPIHVSIIRNHTKVVRLLVQQHEIDINIKTDRGSTALILAAATGKYALVRLLLEHTTIDINAVDDRQQTAHAWAARKGYAEILKLLN